MTKQDIEKSKLVLLLMVWKTRAQDNANAHYYASDRYSFRSLWLTVTNIILTIFVLFIANSGLISEIINEEDKLILGLSPYIYKLLIGFLSVWVVITTMIQYYMRYKEISSLHKFSANEYSNIKRKIERLLASEYIDEDSVHMISNSLNWAGKSSPPIRHTIFSKARESYPSGKKEENIKNLDQQLDKEFFDFYKINPKPPS